MHPMPWFIKCNQSDLRKKEKKKKDSRRRKPLFVKSPQPRIRKCYDSKQITIFWNFSFSEENRL